MKNIKKVFYYLATVALVLGVSSCEDEEKFRFPELGNGGFVKFVSAPVFEAGADPVTASFNAVTEDPNENVASYELSVRGFFDGAPEDTLVWRSTTTFPFDVSFTGADMAAFFNVDIEVFQEGDSFEFFSSIVTDDGKTWNFLTPDCECPNSDEEPDPNGGVYNGGNTNPVLLNADGLLQALNYEVEFEDPAEG